MWLSGEVTRLGRGDLCLVYLGWFCGDFCWVFWWCCIGEVNRALLALRMLRLVVGDLELSAFKAFLSSIILFRAVVCRKLKLVVLLLELLLMIVLVFVLLEKFFKLLEIGFCEFKFAVFVSVLSALEMFVLVLFV